MMLHTIQHSFTANNCISFPKKDEYVRKGKKTEPYFTEYLNSAVIGPCSDSAASDSVTTDTPKLPSGYVYSKTAVAYRLIPKMRMLRRVLNVLPKSFTICEGYRVTCHIEELECGHTQITYKPNYGAKRRNCKSCVNEEQEHQKAVNE